MASLLWAYLFDKDLSKLEELGIYHAALSEEMVDRAASIDNFTAGCHAAYHQQFGFVARIAK